MATKEIKTYTLQEMKNMYVSEIGTQERDEYGYKLRMHIIAQKINQARADKKL